MTRKDKALLKPDNRVFEHGIETKYSNGTWHGCCPFYIDCGNENMDDNTRIGKYGDVTGCRGITCKECWDKDVDA